MAATTPPVSHQTCRTPPIFKLNFVTSQPTWPVQTSTFQVPELNIYIGKSNELFKCKVLYLSTVNPTRCTNPSNLFYFGITLYMFRTVFPSVIRSFKTVHTATGVGKTGTAACLLAGTRWNSLHLVHQKDRPKHVECYSKIKWIWETDACSWIYCRNIYYDAWPFERQIYKALCSIPVTRNFILRV
jgi:hypothetical protein